MPSRLTIIVATDARRGIGIGGQLPWRLPEDMAHFKRVTTGHAVVMGRKTFDSIGRPLPDRRNVVITRNPAWQHAGVETAASFDAALAQLRGQEIFIIGGAQIYAQALPHANRLILTEIDQTFDCDTFFPAIDPTQWVEVARERHHSERNGCDFCFVTYGRT